MLQKKNYRELTSFLIEMYLIKKFLLNSVYFTLFFYIEPIFAYN